MAKATGFIQRQRKFSAFEFVLLMTIKQTSLIHPSLSGIVEAACSKISSVALHSRFTAQSVEFLLACLRMILEYSVLPAGITPIALDAFNRVYIFDSSGWDIDPKLKHILPGSGGRASDANCKLQAGYEYKPWFFYPHRRYQTGSGIEQPSGRFR